jgi:hypothetical protein
MRNLQWILLAASVALGIIWVFFVQDLIFLHLVAGLLYGPGLNLKDFLQKGSSPAFYAFWAGCISALLIWISITWSARPRSSSETRQMQPMWWLAAAILVFYGWLCLGWFLAFRWQVSATSPVDLAGTNYYPLGTGGIILMMGFVMLDVILLFWLPTLLASPRTYRLVVPGAVTLLGSR